MKVILLDTDPRQHFDPLYHTNMGSFSIVSNNFNRGLKKINYFADCFHVDSWVGISDGLNFGFEFPSLKKFIVHVWDCINVLPNEIIQSQKHYGTKVIGLSNQITNLWRKYGVQAETVMPGTDTDFYKPIEVDPAYKNLQFSFLFDSFANVRSGLELAVKAFDLAFRGNKDVQLVIKNTSNSEQLERKLQEYINKGTNIVFVNKRVSFEEMRRYYNIYNVLLSVMHHSSWGLGVHQAAACGCLPVVGDFCPSNEMAIDVKLKPSKEVEIKSLLPELVNEWGLHNAYGNFSYSEEPRFYDYSIEEYSELLKDIYNKWGNKYSKIDTRTRIVENWTLEKSAQNLVTTLQHEV